MNTGTGQDDGAYNAAVLDHFLHPRHAGSLAPGPDVIGAAAGSLTEGAKFAFNATLVHDRLGKLRFQAYGCPHCLAAASWLCEHLQAARIEQLDAWHWRDAAAALDIPAAKYGRLLILEDAIRALAAVWRARQASIHAHGQENSRPERPQPERPRAG
ncbi:hypothetical protein ACG33_06580 [Steroidobacter denitrificans]|uniref:NIF system FeS cluster assembly NifU N-terminal domain-containing protein n=1 Tax=Steroidobacter denitrificans TaxID=465721 RepID=A0A127F8M7_STEDE|nr:iron-sulfur cluster assembly scaffold protein [Steroidobacter denitrificans]AMN46767.1 hypothetical protein ACG33_06580 [Steroidobacter denitrificans]